MEEKMKYGGKHWFRSTLNSQSRLNLDHGGDAIGTVSVGDGDILFAGLSLNKSILSLRVYFGQVMFDNRLVWVAMVDEVDWCDPHEQPQSQKKRKGCIPTVSVSR